MKQEEQPPKTSHDDAVTQTIQSQEPNRPQLARLNEMLRGIANTYGVGVSMAVQAALIIAGNKWTIEDELRFGYVTRDELGELIGKDVKYDK